MPIEFTIREEHGYFVAKVTGTVTDDELLASFRNFFESHDGAAELNELADMSDVTGAAVTPEGVRRLAEYIGGFYATHGITTVPRRAVFAPEDLEFGLSRLYGAMAEDFETFRVFRELGEAIAWLGVPEDSKE